MKIEIADNLFSEKEGLFLIKEYCEDGNLGNREIFINEILPESSLALILKRAKPHFDDYKKTIPINKDLFYDKVIAIKNANKDGEPHPMHYDEAVSLYPFDLGISAFVSLIYLSDNFSGGQLYFPFQNKIVEPKIGRMVTFPSGPIYPHKVLPFYGENRYLLRIFHLFYSGLEVKDRNNLLKRLNIEQEKEEL